MTKVTTLKNLAAYLRAILNPAPEKLTSFCPPSAGFFMPQIHL
jgi:hypothetical protein